MVICVDFVTVQVAGTIGGATYGVAKGATLVALRVLGCTGSGTLQALLDAFNWVLNDDAPAVRLAGLWLGLPVNTGNSSKH